MRCPDCDQAIPQRAGNTSTMLRCSECGQEVCTAHWCTHQDMQRRYRRCYFLRDRWREVKRAAAQLGGAAVVALLLVLFSDYGAGGATWMPW